LSSEKEKTLKLRQNTIKGSESRSAKDNVANTNRMNSIQYYYAEKLGFNNYKANGLTTQDCMMATNKSKGVEISEDYFFHITGYLNNSLAFMNCQVHEYFHWVNHSNIYTEPDDTGEKSVKNQKAAKAHLDAYMAQIDHETWGQIISSIKDVNYDSAEKKTIRGLCRPNHKKHR
jgi:hypothetical protein